MRSTDILILCGAGYVSGKEVMVLTLAEGLILRGRAVHVLSSTWNDGEFIARLESQRIAHSQLALGFISATLRWSFVRMTLEQLYRLPGLLLGYNRVLKAQSPRCIVHTNWHHILLLFPALRCERDFLWMHEVIPDRPQHRAFFSALAPRLRKFIAVSNAVANSLLRAGVPAHKVQIIHNGIPDPGEATMRTAVEKTAEVRLGIVGQVGEWKGHPDLVDAMSLLAGEYPALKLTIFGNDKGPYPEELKARIDRLGLADRVTWAGFVKDRSAIYGAIDICVVPSRSEDPLPTAAIEAGFWGLPVVATRRGGLPEIIDHELSGLLVAANSPPELAAAIGQLAADPERRRAIGANARRRAKAHFSQERFVSEFLAAIESRESPHE